MAFPQTTPGMTSPLDGPPPSPTPMSGAQGPLSMQGLAPSISSSQMPPEVLTGITAAAGTIAQQLDSFAQITPDKAAILGLIKDMLQQYLADLMVAGAGPTSATAPGAAFPGGGIGRGISGPGSV